ncbi:myosin light chain kinase, smooth muscle-like [Grus japonensis]|uniref:Myosin light chain kinase, smooth muscle-like n=1 Tax=Grus japonensis TaxID=30415 RepID=A0ABC9XX31_GRUJA
MGQGQLWGRDSCGSRYHPQPVSVTWRGAAAADDVTFPAVRDSIADLNLVVSRLRLPHGTHRDGYTCSVNHPPTSTSLTKEVKVCEASSTPIPPEVQVFYTSSCSSSTGDESVELVCLISGFTPATVEVEWLVDGISGLLTATQTRPCQEDGAATFSTSSRTNVSRFDWLEGKTFTCQVKHPATRVVTQGHARLCSGEEMGLVVAVEGWHTSAEEKVGSSEGCKMVVGSTSGEGWVTMVGLTSGEGCKMVVGSTTGEGWVTMVGLTSGEGCKMVVGSTSGEGWVTMVGLTSGEGCKMVVGSTTGEGCRIRVGGSSEGWVTRMVGSTTGED